MKVKDLIKMLNRSDGEADVKLRIGPRHNDTVDDAETTSEYINSPENIFVINGRSWHKGNKLNSVKEPPNESNNAR